MFGFSWQDLDPDIPRPGWPGRRGAIAALLFKLTVELLVLVSLFLAFYFSFLVIWAVQVPTEVR